MIRFIDLRGQLTGYNFAFWDTVTDRFLEFSGDFAWGYWDDFEEVAKGDLSRYEGLCPSWVFPCKVCLK